MKMISLLKVAFSQDMNIFNISLKQKKRIFGKYILPVVLFVVVCLCIGFYTFTIAEKLLSTNNTHIILSIFIMLVTITAFFEGIYKSQEILFDAKDNDLLLSLPIKKSYILITRLLKLFVFQYIFNLMFLLPAFYTYVYYERPTAGFYYISVLMSLLIPIIPTVIACFFGYVIRLISSKFRKRKIIQTFLSIIIYIFLFYVGTKIGNSFSNLGSKTSDLNAMIEKTYLPIKLYMNLIMDFEIGDLLKLVAINIIPLVIFVLIASIFYFKIIAKSQEVSLRRKTVIKYKQTIQRAPMIALIIKEIKRYFASPIYIFNALSGPLILLALSIFLFINKGDGIRSVFSMSGLDFVYYLLLLIIGAMTQISSSSVSLEGKTINITKSLPATENMILESKLLAAIIIETPLLILNTLFFVITSNCKLIYAILLFGISIIMPVFFGCIGLIVNLKYPKMNVTSDTEIVKQSMSVTISSLIGLAFFVGSLIFIVQLNKFLIIELVLLIHFALLIYLTKFTYNMLMRYGPDMYKSINI